MHRLEPGMEAPDFSLSTDAGGLVSLKDFRGRKLVLYFYPRADTPGCTREAVAFHRLVHAFERADTAILGVSADPVPALTKFKAKHRLSIPLASDATRKMLAAYDVWGEKKLYGRTFMGVKRTTYLIDRDGRVAKAWVKVKVDGHADEVLEAARTL